MKTSVIICTKDRIEDIKRCLESILVQTIVPDETIIIDSSVSKESIDKLAEFIRKETSIKHFIYNVGLTKARNIGIKKSVGDIIIFVDDDVILDNNYISEILKIFKTYNNIGLVTGNIVRANMETRTFQDIIKNPFIREMRSFFFLLFLLGRYENGYFLPSGFPRFPAGENIKTIECVPGANMAFKRSILDEFRFDERLDGYSFMEDCDISYRVSRKYKVMYTPFAKLVHNLSPVSRDNDFKRSKMLLKNHFYLFTKNFPHTIKYRFAFLISVVGLFVMAILRFSITEIKGILCGCIDILMGRNVNLYYDDK